MSLSKWICGSEHGMATGPVMGEPAKEAMYLTARLKPNQLLFPLPRCKFSLAAVHSLTY